MTAPTPAPKLFHSSAVVAQQVARLPFLVGGGGSSPTPRLQFTPATAVEVNALLAHNHYLGPVSTGRACVAGFVDDVLVACMVFRWPMARMLQADGSVLELSRWCLTEHAGRNAGSRMMRWTASHLRREVPTVRSLVSYSDPVHGHSGSLYKASGWTYAPTHHSLRFDANGRGYPSGHGSWNGVDRQSPKHRWTFNLSAKNEGSPV